MVCSNNNISDENQRPYCGERGVKTRRGETNRWMADRVRLGKNGGSMEEASSTADGDATRDTKQNRRNPTDGRVFLLGVSWRRQPTVFTANFMW